MITEAISPPGAGILDDLPGVPPSSAAPAGPNFGAWFTSELMEVNHRLVTADRAVQTLAVGGAENLHEVMIHLEEARLSFQLLTQVRNRLLEAYQEVMRMQV
jgi:flagellar hook-basal body complex protein FliE